MTKGVFMKNLIALSVTTLVLTFNATAATNKQILAVKQQKSYSFQYKAPQMKPFKVIRTAVNAEEAFKLAAQDCFNQLTQGKYPGEEKGLQIIDICANPKI